MAVWVVANALNNADAWYDLYAGDTFLLTSNATFATWSVSYPTGLFGSAAAPAVTVVLNGTFLADSIRLYGGDRVTLGATSLTQLNDAAGMHLSTSLTSGMSRVLIDGSLLSGLADASNGITADLGSAPGTKALDLVNRGLIDATGIGVALVGTADGSFGTLTNSGTINGAVAVQSSGAADVILNSGTMAGDGSAVIRAEALLTGDFAPQIVNTGTLTFSGLTLGHPASAAISVARGASLGTTSAEIENSGSIFGHGRAIWLDVDSATVVNTGRISGAIVSVGGAVEITNDGGTIAGRIFLGSGEDTLTNGGDITGLIDLGAGNDTLDFRGGRLLGLSSATGGEGSDSYYVDRGALNIAEDAAAAGVDTVYAETSYHLRTNFENLTLLAGGDWTGIGNSQDNLILGNVSDNRLVGAGGNDEIHASSGEDRLLGGTGNDTLYGELGDDTLDGGMGADVLYGGSGADVFVFFRPGYTNRLLPDRIEDFVRGEDLIDLSHIDANTTNANADDAFSFIGSSVFTGVAGQLRATFVGPETWIRMDVNGDGRTDGLVVLTGNIRLTAPDFLL